MTMAVARTMPEAVASRHLNDQGSLKKPGLVSTHVGLGANLFWRAADSPMHSECKMQMELKPTNAEVERLGLFATRHLSDNIWRLTTAITSTEKAINKFTFFTPLADQTPSI
jgi:hypothetical protein